MPRVTLSWARAGVSAGPPPAAATAIAVSNAIARAAGAVRRVLIGVPCKDIPIFCQTGREPSDALGGGQRGRPSRLGHGWAVRKQSAEYGNSGAGQGARRTEKRCSRRQNSS